MFFFKARRPEFQGYVDDLTGNRLSGWAADRIKPKKRQTVEVYCAGNLVASVRADLFRQDLANNGIGDGFFGFSCVIPEENIHPETIAVKIRNSDFWLINNAVSHETVSQLDALLNSRSRGLPILNPGLSFKVLAEDDIEIAKDLLEAWQSYTGIKGSHDYIGHKTMWDEIVVRRHATLLDLLNGKNPRLLAEFLVNVQKSQASEGITQGERSYRDFLSATPDGRRAAVSSFHDMLASLVQYMALERAECTEQNFDGSTLSFDTQQLVTHVENALGHSIVSPPVFDGLFGLSVAGGILHGRDIQALYAALRAIEASAAAKPRLCEIGGGFGKAAYYAWLRGVRHYTIIDLPTVAAMQYFYLRKALPHVSIHFTEPSDMNTEDGIKLMFASQMKPNTKLSCDLVLNCDSFPEMGDAICRDYFALIRTWAPLLLSINQEANREIRGPHDRQTVVGQHLPDFGYTRIYRFRSWIRKGFIDELWAAPR